MSAARIAIVDDLLSHPKDYRVWALLSPFEDVASPAGVFHGVAPVGSTAMTDALVARGLQPTFSAFRLSPAGQHEPNFIHTDRDMGDWTAILYLNPEPPADDGTTFWRHRASGAVESTAETASDELRTELLEWRRIALWEPWRTVAAKFNRMLVFPSGYFHSRALFDNYGENNEDARLVQITFGTGVI